MSIRILTVALRQDSDLVVARQRARQLAQALGFPHTEQIAIATAVSEIARNALRYAKGGRVEFEVERVASGPPAFSVRVIDSGPGIANLEEILSGRYSSETGMGLGLVGARRLMDRCEIDTRVGEGTTVTLAKALPASERGRADFASIAMGLPMLPQADGMEELELQNRELLKTLAELSRNQEEMSELARELEDTNRGVMALYAELDEKAASLRNADEAKTRFLSNMGHEFRTPLSSVRALCRLLVSQADGPLHPEQETQVRFIARAVDDLAELVNDLLDIAKIESGKVDVRVVTFSVEELFSTLRGMMRPLQTPGVELVFNEPHGLPPMRSDDGKIAQILRNFISNALKYTEHGRVTVAARRGRDGRSIEFSVADTGIGISAEHRVTIFEEFVQVPGPLQSRVKGTGLGLPLCRKLATLLGGSVTVESTPGKGSVFMATLPIEYGSEAGVPLPPPSAIASQGFILVVEPSDAHRANLETLLKTTGYEPFCVPSVAQGREVMTSVRPAAILISGESAAEAHHANRWLLDLKGPGSVPIPVLVAGPASDAERSLAAGADWHVATPCDSSELVTALQRLLYARSENPPVLIIDDDEAARYVLRKLLDTDTRIEEASDGTRGIELAGRSRPRWIFLDLNMPGLQGGEVLERLKADTRTSDIPVVIVTARDLGAFERAQLEPHVKAILSKNDLSRESIARVMR